MPYKDKTGFKMYGKSPMMKAAILDSPMDMYKSDAQRKAVHASKAEKSAMKKYGCKKCKSAMCMCGAKYKK